MSGRHSRVRFGGIRLLMLCVLVALVGVAGSARGQVECMPWGNIMGIRVGGELMEFETSVRLVRSDWSGFTPTVKYKQKPKYLRQGARRTIDSQLEGGLSLREVVDDTGDGSAHVSLELTAQSDIDTAGAYFCVELPATDYAGGSVEGVDAAPGGADKVPLATAPRGGGRVYLQSSGKGVRVALPNRRLEVLTDAAVEIRVRRDLDSSPTVFNDPEVLHTFARDDADKPAANYQVYFAVMPGRAARGRTAHLGLTLKVSAEIDRAPVRVTLDPAHPGKPFDGIGGNFRIQFGAPDRDAMAYCLENLRVAWGRIGMPWNEWHRDENSDPLAEARAGRLSAGVVQSMETARTLSSRKIPLIVSVWSPPQWAKAPDPTPGLRGTALNPAKSAAVYESIGKYLLYLKEAYGAEAALFSFNESNEGVNIRQTPEEHDAFIKGLGARLAGLGLKTRLLLGDTSHFTPESYRFIKAALDDPQARKFIGAVGFHTWRGMPEKDLGVWVEAAGKLGVPLLATECGPDAHAHEYPSYFLEPSFQLHEIDFYTRICSLGQPATMMEWQLTADYSVLSGGGVYGVQGPLRPTQRFYNLKQLGTTPPGARAVPARIEGKAISCAAFVDPSTGGFAVHLVNTGAARAVTVSGIPAAVKRMRLYVTDATRGMEEGQPVAVSSGSVTLPLDAMSYTSLFGSP